MKTPANTHIVDQATSRSLRSSRSASVARQGDRHVDAGTAGVIVLRALSVMTLLIMAISSARGQFTGFYGVTTLGNGDGDGGGYGASLQVSTIANLNFSCLRRNEQESIEYRNVNAGQFKITGKAGRNVRLRLSISDVQLDGSHMTMTVHPSDVAYSRDGGITWRQFQDVSLILFTEFPPAPQGQPSVILVRIGGTLQCGPGQERGQYSGSIRLSANYE